MRGHPGARVARVLVRTGARKGLMGGSRSWLVIWVVVAGTRLVRRFIAGKEEVIYSGELEEGGTLVVSTSQRG